MEKKEYIIRLSDDVVETLSLDEHSVLELKNEPSGYLISRKTDKQSSQSISLRWFLIPSFVATLIFLGVILSQELRQVPMSGHLSIASMVIVLGLISGILSFSTSLIKQKRNPNNLSLQDIYWRNIPTIILSFVVILGLILLAFFWVVGIIFDGASFDQFTATALFFIFLAVINYMMIYMALTFNSPMIIQVLITVIIGGVFWAMITNSQDQWWQYNFSYLGTRDAASSWQFNLTLMLSALLMIALIDYLFVILQKFGYEGWRLTTLRTLLTLVAISLGGVGFFPNNGGRLHELHDRAANMLVYLIIILIVSIRWILPKVTKEFLLVSYGIAGVLIIADILFQVVGYLSLTAFELTAFGLAFAWIMLLLQHIQKLTSESLGDMTIELIPLTLKEQK